MSKKEINRLDILKSFENNCLIQRELADRLEFSACTRQKMIGKRSLMSNHISHY